MDIHKTGEEYVREETSDNADSEEVELTADTENPDYFPGESIEAIDIPNPCATKDSNQRIGMKDLPDNLVTKCVRAKINVDEGRETIVKDLQTGTVSYISYFIICSSHSSFSQNILLKSELAAIRNTL